MSKYKLKKEYPNSPPKGTIVELTGSAKCVCNNGYIDKETLENNPEFWGKIEEPLFTTEDGMKIYEGDSYYIVTPSFKINYVPRASEHCIDHGLTSKYSFSTKEKAQQYVDKHKPKYSKFDVQQIVDKAYWKSRIQSHPQGEFIDTTIFFEIINQKLDDE